MENGSESRSEKFRILVAEDFPISQEMAVLLLEKVGFLVDAADNGQEAFEKVQHNKYDVVLMDVQMPVLDGFQATRRIRELEMGNHNHTPIIAMTAQNSAEDQALCLAAGMDGYVTKPIGIEKLLEAMNPWLHPESVSPTEDIFDDKHDQAGLGEESPMVAVSADLPEEDDETFLYYESEDYSNGASPAPKEDEAPVNLQLAIDFFMNDQALLQRMLQVFVLQLPDRMVEIILAMERQNSHDLHRLAHALKGGLLNFSAQPAARIAAELEALSEENDYLKLRGLVRQLETEIERIRLYCKNELRLNI